MTGVGNALISGRENVVLILEREHDHEKLLVPQEMVATIGLRRVPEGDGVSVPVSRFSDHWSGDPGESGPLKSGT